MSPIKRDVKRKTLLPEAEARSIFAASSPPAILPSFFFRHLTVLACRGATEVHGGYTGVRNYR
jgi:hypothetical protein